MLIKDPAIAIMLGARARQSLEGVFDWGTIASGVADVYLQLMRKQKGLSRQSLVRYLKSSYTPTLENEKKVSDFVIDGELVYPSFSKTE